ncbi:unnamed protein product [Caenorhabditis brenneri]
MRSRRLMSGYTQLQNDEAELADRLDRIQIARVGMNFDEEDVDVDEHNENVERFQLQIVNEVLEAIARQNEVRVRNADTDKINMELAKERTPDSVLIFRNNYANSYLHTHTSTAHALMILSQPTLLNSADNALMIPSQPTLLNSSESF